MNSITEHFNKEAKNHDNNFINDMGMSEFYNEIENQLNKCSVKNNILVLGCGTGLEIERIKFKADVTAVDISKNMLTELCKKGLYSEVTLNTICGSFLEIDFPSKSFDIILACYAMHHFVESQKASLYKKIYNWLSDDGVFLNGDTMEKTRQNELNRLAEAEKIYKEQNLPFGSLHIDIPFCYGHELEVLKNAGFKTFVLEKEWDRTKLYRAK